MDEVMEYHQRIKLPYRYTTGEATAEFLTGLEAGSVMGSVCDSCDATVVPARPFCPSCSGRMDRRVAVASEGVVTSYTVEASGRVVGLIRLEGTDTDLAHVLDVDDPRIGMAVKARWAGDPVAEITSIEAFEAV